MNPRHGMVTDFVIAWCCRACTFHWQVPRAPEKRCPGELLGGTLRMTIFLRSAALATILAGASALPSLAADPLGNWLTEKSEATIRIVNCGAELCGTIVALKEPNDPATGRPKTDKNNPDASKRNRPVVGITMVFGMKPNGP